VATAFNIGINSASATSISLKNNNALYLYVRVNGSTQTGIPAGGSASFSLNAQGVLVIFADTGLSYSDSTVIAVLSNNNSQAFAAITWNSSGTCVRTQLSASSTSLPTTYTGPFQSSYTLTFSPSGTGNYMELLTRGSEGITPSGTQRLTISADTTITKSLITPGYNLSLQNEQNMKQVRDGNTIYSSLPLTLKVSTAKTLYLSGKDDPTITVNYANTSTPVVTNT
jgi:hypothetical protein